MTAFIDRVDILEADERMGCLRALKQVCRVVGMDKSVGWDALYAALTQIGVPQYGQFLDDNAQGFHVVLTGRSVKIVDGDPGTFDVILQWSHVLDGPFQDLKNGGPNGAVWGKYRSSLVQKQTNLEYFVDEGTITSAKIPITVEYRYPTNANLQPGQLEIQGGEVGVSLPQGNYQLHGYIDTSQPQQYRKDLLGKVNSLPFLGDPPGCWLCSEVRFEIMAVVPTGRLIRDLERYEFYLEFQLDDNGWDPGVVFVDNMTNRPPPDLIEGVGYRNTVEYLPVNFRDYIGRPERID